VTIQWVVLFPARSEGGGVTEFVISWGRGVALTYLFLGAFLCLVVAADLAWPREQVMAHRDRARVLLFAGIYIPIAALVGMCVGLLFEATGLRPLIPGVGLADTIVAILLGDFAYYWFHRAQHRFKWLWRIHAVHHSIEKFGAGTGYHHPLEAPLKVALVGIPTALLFGGTAGAVASFVVTLHGYYVHSTTRLNFGPLSWLVCDNRVHRIHHSREPVHFNRNFGVVTLIWDRLFGTAALPANGEWPDIGIDDRPEPRSLREYLTL
jgi:sterol desaturase/sphingolipid hydroxylase (fatty acid hydroxylase superfamily)